MSEPRPTSEGRIVRYPVSPTVWGRIDAPSGVILERDARVLSESNARGISRDRWERMCAAPCDMQLSTDFRYRIRGDGITTSNTFFLRAPEEAHEIIHVRSASSSLFVLGVIGLGTGGAIALAGSMVVFFSNVSLDGSEGSIIETSRFSDGRSSRWVSRLQSVASC